MVQISLPGHSPSLHSNFFLYFLWANEVQRFISLQFEVPVCLFAHFDYPFSAFHLEYKIAIFVKTKVEMINSASTNRNKVSSEDDIGGN